MSGTHDNSMLLMGILPAMLVFTILIATVLDRRGYLGPSFRVVGLAVPFAAIAASTALGTSAIYFLHAGEALDLDRGLGLYALAAGLFYLFWAQLYLASRQPWAATIGALGTVVVILGSLAFGFVALPGMAGSAVFLGAFQLALIMMLVPSIAPGLAATLAEREMPVQRAVVLGGFGVATVALFTCAVLVGGALPA
jgi:hypothetical protein